MVERTTITLTLADRDATRGTRATDRVEETGSAWDGCVGRCSPRTGDVVDVERLVRQRSVIADGRAVGRVEATHAGEDSRGHVRCHVVGRAPRARRLGDVHRYRRRSHANGDTSGSGDTADGIEMTRGRRAREVDRSAPSARGLRGIEGLAVATIGADGGAVSSVSTTDSRKISGRMRRRYVSGRAPRARNLHVVHGFARITVLADGHTVPSARTTHGVELSLPLDRDVLCCSPDASGFTHVEGFVITQVHSHRGAVRRVSAAHAKELTQGPHGAAERHVHRGTGGLRHVHRYIARAVNAHDRATRRARATDAGEITAGVGSRHVRRNIWCRSVRRPLSGNRREGDETEHHHQGDNVP